MLFMLPRKAGIARSGQCLHNITELSVVRGKLNRSVEEKFPWKNLPFVKRHLGDYNSGPNSHFLLPFPESHVLLSSWDTSRKTKEQLRLFYDSTCVVSQQEGQPRCGKFKCVVAVQNSTRSRQVPQAFPSTVSSENIFNNM